MHPVPYHIVSCTKICKAQPWLNKIRSFLGIYHKYNTNTKCRGISVGGIGRLCQFSWPTWNPKSAGVLSVENAYGNEKKRVWNYGRLLVLIYNNNKSTMQNPQ